MKITRLLELIINIDYHTKEVVVYAILITLNVVLLAGIAWLAYEEYWFKKLD